ncbi:MAG: hypothetical protein IKC09_06850 [Oscillospiraceae bacterium]|nr:hypothetical protein [Oscillospiraceae bacterium]MBR2889973.1 hypothetical protein [Oscillospiraceae bacterium]
MNKHTILKFLTRMAVYCVGLLILAFGVVLSVNSNLGVSPVSSLPYVISVIARAPLGICVTLTYCGFILLQVLIQRRDFKAVNLLEILFSTIFGYFVDFAELILNGFTFESYAGRLGMLTVSIVLIAVGLTIYVGAHLVPMPMEGLVGCISDKTGKAFSTVKTVIDCIVVLTGIVLSLVFLGSVEGIREGTVITAIVTGKIVGIARKYLVPILDRICA